MNPIKFKECNTVYAKDQPEYLPLHCHKSTEGIVTSCWKLSLWEKIQVIFTGRLFLQLMTFNQPLQPLMMFSSNPLHQDAKQQEE